MGYPEFELSRLPVRWSLPDETVLVLRLIRAADVPLIADFYRQLSPSCKHLNFGDADIVLGDTEAQHHCTEDASRALRLVVVTADGGSEEAVAVGHLMMASDRDSLALGFLVKDGWQMLGIGGQLLEMLLWHARARHYKSARVEVLSFNRQLLAFLGRRGFAIKDSCAGTWHKTATILL